MEAAGSIPHSQVPATIQSLPPHLTSWRSLLILSSRLRLGLPSGLFPSGFPTKTMYTPLLSPLRATCTTHLILLNFITRTILDEQYKSLSFSLCSFPHSPVTSSLLGQNILLNTLRHEKSALYSFRIRWIQDIYLINSLVIFWILSWRRGEYRWFQQDFA